MGNNVCSCFTSSSGKSQMEEQNDFMQQRFQKMEQEDKKNNNVSPVKTNDQPSTQVIPQATQPQQQDNKPKKGPYEVSLNDFVTMKCLARGSFGKVLLVENKDTKKLYAMKTLKKADIINRNQIENALSEKKILQFSDHPFVVKLKFAFQNEFNIYFIMEYMAGGELFNHIKLRSRFQESTVVYYSSQVVLALEYLHETLGIIYRDLKPENILMDEQGNIKLSDFGFAKSTAQQDKSYSFCGTPEYLAPEIINGKVSYLSILILNQEGHSKPVDIWTLGCFIYEMLNGSPPFRHPQRQLLYNSIIQNKITYPEHFSECAKDLISNLLVNDPEKRLTIAQIKVHPFFQKIKWEQMLQKKYKAPVVPKLTELADTTYHVDANNQILDTPQVKKIDEGMQDKFLGITFRGTDTKLE